MSEENYGNLDVIAKSLDCVFAGKPSWRVMLTKIAKGELSVISAQKKIDAFSKIAEDSRQLSWVEPKGPVYAEVPVVHSPYVKQIPFSENTCDTSEFDTPVPQRRTLASSEPVAMPKPISVSGPLSPEDKREMFDKLKGLMKKGSDLL